LPDKLLRQIAALYYSYEMIGEFQSRVELHVRHVAADAISFSARVRVHSATVMTSVTFLVVKGRIISPGVPVRGVTRCTTQFAARKTAAFHEPEGLEADIFE
jgi:hypothetical protein